jgi:hypothetical protein
MYVCLCESVSVCECVLRARVRMSEHASVRDREVTTLPLSLERPVLTEVPSGCRAGMARCVQ